MKPVLFLGIIDLFAAVSLALLYWDIRVLPYIALILFLGKAIIFFKSIASIIDILAGITFILALTGVMFNILTWIAVIWILQKAIVSILFSL